MRAIACLLALALFVAPVGAGMWDPVPMTVHEWGVNTFDWDTGKKLDQGLPAYLYTDKKPGKVVAKPDKRVRDLPADSGIRTKPILYFYPSKFGFEKPPQVGVEMRFAEGFANAWWPQVNRYRGEKESLAAKAPDWEAWKIDLLGKHKKNVLGNRAFKDPEKKWEEILKVYESLGGDEQIAYLANQMRWFGESDFPEDERMQLVWDRLTLHETPPENLQLPGRDLPDDHWTKVARDVDAAYVSNGKETERYVFYEGETREKPAIALLPQLPAPHWSLRGDGQAKETAIVNVSDFPIYNVIAVYRDSEKGILWTSHIPLLPAIPKSRPLVDQVAALRIPDFNRPAASDKLKIDADEFDRRTRHRLIESLTAGYHYDPGRVTMRDPADPQPPTVLHQLFEKEAVGLEKIWHDDFFKAEGLTVIYRESPAYLDKAMPLNIYTSMFWYVKLSRCGIVLNRNLPFNKVDEVAQALRRLEYSLHNKQSEKEREQMEASLRANRLLTSGIAEYRYGRSHPMVFADHYAPLRKKLAELLE